jgi:predicted HTH transcriptional regulator
LTSEKFKIPEGRKIEFKETLPSGNKLERTAVAFSNDAGGEIYIGVKSPPRMIVGVPEDELIKLEERIGNLIYENCYPTIIPDILFQNIDGKHIIIVKIHPGSLTPYYIKSLGKEQGTFVRAGSSNKLADREIIEELERRRRNISFDSTIFYDAAPSELKWSSFTKLYMEKTGKEINKSSLSNLGLIKKENEKEYPTVSAVLLSDKLIKQKYFHYSKIECARFKGITTDTTLDSKTIDEPICLQPDLAIAFVQRNIKKGSKIGDVYREERWEYPLLAVRELIINAVIHRDYSFQGKDIKVAIFDDMLEITSPGTIPPTIDINDLTSGQSEIRNRTLAPIFKELKLIEQWGTGFKKLSDELKEYPEIEIKFNEPGLSFQVQFIKKDYKPAPSDEQAGTKLGLSWDQVGTKSGLSRDQVEKILKLSANSVTITELMNEFGWTNRTKFRVKFISPLLELNLISMTIPGKPNSSKQRYVITAEGKILLEELNK